jgi:hypothetical protein
LNAFSEFDLIYKGSDAFQRRGIFYTVSGLDHPVTKLSKRPFKATQGTSVLVSLSSQHFDRSELTQGVFCEDDSQMVPI